MTTVYQYIAICTGDPVHQEFVWGTSLPSTCSIDGSPIDTNLSSAIRSISTNDVTLTNLPNSTFGEVPTAELTPLIQLNFTYNNCPQLVTETLTGSGSTTNTDGMAVASSSAAISSSARLATNLPIKNRSGQGILVRFTAVFSAGVAGNDQYAGAYDIVNGIGFGFNGIDFGIFKRSDSITDWYLQTDWNVDKLDGTGPSGVNIDFGVGYGNVFEIKYKSNGFGGIVFKVENPYTAQLIVVHVIQYANSSSTPTFENDSFPICIESINTTNNTNVDIKSTSMFAALEGQIVYSGPQFTDTWNGDVTVTTDETFIKAFRVKSTFGGKTNKSIIYPILASFSTGSTDQGQILRIRKNGVITGGTWNDIDTGSSCVECNTDGSWSLGANEGMTIIQKNVPSKGDPTVINMTPSSSGLYLVADDILIITGESVKSKGINIGSLTWIEDQ